MPFDALLAPERPKLLTDILAEYGIAPVGMETLAAHKQSQVERFAPSFWYRHQPVLPVALLGSVGCMAFTGGLAQRALSDGSPIPGWLTLSWMCVIGLLIGAGVFRVRAGAHWEERWVPSDWLPDLGVPEQIAALARDLTDQIPGSTLILGELKQEYVVLDPYLLLDCDGEQACLGIWEGNKVIACPQRQ
jgi:hypothetical protein